MAKADITTFHQEEKEEELSFVHVYDDSSLINDGKSASPFNNRFDAGVSITTNSICSFVHISAKSKDLGDDNGSLLDGVVTQHHQFGKMEDEYYDPSSVRPFVVENIMNTSNSLCYDVVLDNDDDDDDLERSVLTIGPLSIVSHNTFSYKEALLTSPISDPKSPENKTIITEDKSDIDNDKFINNDQELSSKKEEVVSQENKSKLVLLVRQTKDPVFESKTKTKIKDQTKTTTLPAVTDNGKNEEINEGFVYRAQKNQRGGMSRRQRRQNKKKKKKKLTV